MHFSQQLQEIHLSFGVLNDVTGWFSIFLSTLYQPSPLSTFSSLPIVQLKVSARTYNFQGNYLNNLGKVDNIFLKVSLPHIISNIVKYFDVKIFLSRHTSYENILITTFTKLFKIQNKKLSIVKSVPVNWQGMENIFATKTFSTTKFFCTFTVPLKVFLHRTSFNVSYIFYFG